MNEALNEAVAALRPEMTAALQRLVRKKSVEGPELPVKPFGADVDACFTEALTLCRELGFETTDLDRYIGWCEIGSGDEMVAVLGHLDVVPETTIMQYSRFSSVICSPTTRPATLESSSRSASADSETVTTSDRFPFSSAIRQVMILVRLAG